MRLPARHWWQTDWQDPAGIQDLGSLELLVVLALAASGQLPAGSGPDRWHWPVVTDSASADPFFRYLYYIILYLYLY